jgi:undecaprenyl-diphosphatase
VAPGELTIVVGGVVAGQGKVSVVALMAIVWGAAVLGDTLSFLLGQRLGHDFIVRHGPRVRITPARLSQVEGFFARHGGKTILVGRFVGLVRALAPFIAGASRMPYRSFIPYSVLGAGIWGVGLVALGYVFWQSFDRVAAIAGRGALALATVIVLVVAVVAAVRYLRVPANRARAAGFAREQAARPQLRPVVAVAAPVWRGAVRPAARGTLGSLRFTRDRLTPGALGLELTSLLAVLAVGIFAAIALGTTVGDTSLRGDVRASMIASDLRDGTLVDVAKRLTWLGALPVAASAVGLTSVLLLLRRRWLEATALVAGMTLTVVAVQVTKAAVDRPRPGSPLVHTMGSSFPSGHSAEVIALVAVAVVLSRVVPALAGRFAIVTVAVVLAAAVGLTRIYLRAHYLSDVLAGWGVGAAAFALCGVLALVVAHVRAPARREVRQNDAIGEKPAAR